MFADITTGSHVASATALRNAKWDTCSTIYNWSNQGAWPLPIASIPASENKPQKAMPLQVSCSASSLYGSHKEFGKLNGAIVATGDSHGNLKIFKFPCFVKGSGYKIYRGHSGSVATLGFSSSGSHCISVGKNDRCILQWRKIRAKQASEEEHEAFGASAAKNGLKDQEEDKDLNAEGLFTPESFVNVPHAEANSTSVRLCRLRMKRKRSSPVKPTDSLANCIWN